jgi:uncharacterized SAM-binding protein YcdF (DUF218 family)
MEDIKKLIEIIFSPLGILVISTSAGVLLSFSRRRRQIALRLLNCAGILFLLFLFSPLAQYLMLGLERQYPPLLVPPISPKVDCIVMLAGYAEEIPGVPITSNVSEQTQCTLSEGLRLYRLLPGTKLITSGGIARTEDRPVAASMADFLKQMGIPAEALIAEGKSRTTYENLVEVKKIIGSRPFILVAQGCDLKRAVAVANKLQMKAIPAPAGLWTAQHHPPGMSFSKKIGDFLVSFSHPSLANLTRIQWAYHEYIGLLWYRLLGRI